MLYKEDWDEAKENFKAWWERSLNRPLIQIIAPKEGHADNEVDEIIDSWVFLRYYPDANKAVDLLLSKMERTLFLKEAYPNVWINLGPGVLSAFLGAQLKFDGKAGTAWFEGNMSLDEILEMDFDPENIWWQYLIKCTKIASEKCRGKAIVSFTDLLDPITVVGQLRGRYPTNLLKDMFLSGNKLDKVLRKVQEFWFYCFKETGKLMDVYRNGYSTWADLWSDKSYFVLQCDTIVYLSPKLFDRFVHPYIVEECRFLERSIWHLDGPLELKHLDKLLNIEELDAIQWIPGAGNPEAGEDVWLPLYRKIQSRGKLLQIFVSPERVMHILNKITGKGVAIQTTCASFEEAHKLKEKLELKYQ